MALKLSILVIIIICSIATYFLFTGPNELAIKLGNTDMHNQLVAEFDRNKIPYRIDNEGAIKYPMEFESKVSDLFNKTFERKRSTIYAIDDAHRDEITTKLNSVKIPYELTETDGKIKISWSNEFSNQAHEALNLKFIGGPLDE